MTYEQIKRNYDRKLWSKQMVKAAVKKGSSPPSSTAKSPAKATAWNDFGIGMKPGGDKIAVQRTAKTNNHTQRQA